MNWKIGQSIANRWEVRDIIKGGMADIYVVYDHDPAFDEITAVKVLRRDLDTPELRERFTREALAWVRLDVHENVVQARMIETIEDTPCLFLEYVSGGTLENLIFLDRFRTDQARAVALAIDLCDGMVHATARGILAHRDIKPSNCLIAETGELKVTDFGLAKIFDTARESLIAIDDGETPVVLTRAGSNVGTAPYKAPEQFDDPAEVDVKADIYSFGVMFYQMLTGTLPFEGTAKEIEQMHKTAQIPCLDRSLSVFQAIIERSTAKLPGDRFPDFQVLRADLSDLYVRLTGHAAPPPAIGADLDARQQTNKGAALFTLGYAGEAIGAFDRALKQRPDLQKAWCNRGAALGEIGKHTEAVHDLAKAVQMDPTDDKSWTNLAISLWRLDKKEEAIKCLARARQLRPDLSERHYNEGKYAFDFCKLCMENNRFGEAQHFLVVAHRCFNRTLEIDDSNPDAWVNKGACAALLGDNKEAVECYERARALGFAGLDQLIDRRSLLS